MSGIIEKHAKTELVLRQKVGINDGKILYDEYPCYAFVLDFNQNDFSVFGTVKNGKIFLVAPIENLTPALPAQIVYNGSVFDVMVIKTYRNLKSKILGYRITAFER